MANRKISELDTLAVPSGTTPLPAVIGGATVSVTTLQIVAAGLLAPTNSLRGGVRIPTGGSLTVENGDEIKIIDIADQTLFGNNSGSATAPTALSAAQVRALLSVERLDQIGNPTSDIDLNSRKITNLAAPTSNNDAARKLDVDNAQSGLDVKDSVRAVSETNETLGFATNTIMGGVTVVDGDRVLLIAQTDPIDNGIWIARDSNAAWERPTDFTGSNTVSGGAFTFVSEGNRANTGFVCTTTGNIVVGTDANNWTVFSSTIEIPVVFNEGGTGLQDADVNQGDLLVGPVNGETAYTTVSLPANVGTTEYMLRTNSAGTSPEWTATINGGTF